MGVFSTIGVACAIAVGVAYLAAMTLLPAILVLAGARGLVKPRRELTARFWRRSGVRIVRRPKAHLIGSLLVLAILAGCAGLVNYNYDDRKALGPDAPSSMGYAALERHFPISQAVPEYILVESPRDLRTPQALADLEQMASRVSQLPDISLISGLTRPTGEVPPEFRATYQAGVVGDRMAQGSQVISDNKKDLNRLQNGAGTLASSLNDVRAQINKVAPSMQRMIDALNAVRSQFGGDKLVKQVETAAQLVQSVNALGNSIGVNFSSVREMFAWIGPVLAALNGNAICDANPSCADTRIQFQKLMDARDDGRLDQINSLASQLKGVGDNKSLNATVNQLNATLSQFSSAVRSMGLDSPGGLQAGLTQVRQGANRLADGSQQVAGGVDQLVGQVKLMGDGLDEAAAFLLAMRNDAADPSMAGFNLPSQILQLDEFKKAASIFISPDGHTARYLVLTNLSPFSTQAMDQVNAITDAARSAQPNTQLVDAKITVGGFPAALRDTRDYYQHDIQFIIAMTLIVVLLILMLLLRAIVAPIYLIASVIISYFAALGITVLTFQYLLGQQLHWSVPPLAFVVLVAVGADYNMLLVSRMRDESPRSIRYGIIRTLSSTGGVITAAGLIFAASMSGLLFSSITHRCPGRIPHRHRRSAGHLPGQDCHGARHGDIGGPGQLVAVQAEFAAPLGPGTGKAGGVMSRSITTGSLQAGVGMRRLLATVTALVIVGATGCFGSAIAAADDTQVGWTPDHGSPSDAPPIGTPGKGYALGGAHVLGIPYDEYIKRTGARVVPRAGSVDRRLSRGPGAGPHPRATVSRHRQA